MSHYRPYKGKVISHKTSINSETGVYNESESETNYMEWTVLKTDGNTYRQYHERLGIIKSGHLFNFLRRLDEYMEYQTGRLTISSVGRTPIPLKYNNQISELLKMDRKTVGANIKKLIEVFIIFRINKELFVNPSFIQFGKEFPTYLLEIMIERDKELLKLIPFRNKINIKDFRSVS